MPISQAIPMQEAALLGGVVVCVCLGAAVGIFGRSSRKRPPARSTRTRGEQFEAAVADIFGPVLRARGFALGPVRHDADGLYSALVFRSEAMKLHLYDSVRDGEVNAQVAPLWADDAGWRPDWPYLREAARAPGPPKSFEELLRDVPKEFRSREAQLQELADLFVAQYPRISAFVWHKARREVFREGAPYRVMAAADRLDASFAPGETLRFAGARHVPARAAYVFDFEGAESERKTFWLFDKEDVEVLGRVFELKIAAMPEFAVAVSWTQTDGGYQAQVGPERWTLRLNDFPDEPLYTLFVNHRRVGDFSDWPQAWRK